MSIILFRSHGQGGKLFVHLILKTEKLILKD